MKAVYWLAAITLIATFVLLTLTLGDFLALHDIYSDYVSSDILQKLGIQLSTNLPAWTTTRGEWTLIQVSFFARVLFLLLNAITLGMCVFCFRRQTGEGEVAP